MLLCAQEQAFAFYSPDTGHWLNRDPIDENGGINLYDYVANNPISNIDPLGLQIGAGYGTMPLPHFPENNEPPPTWVTFVPIAGSAAQASYDYKQGKWGWGSFNMGLVVSDIIPARSIIDATVMGLWKAGSHTWSATSKWLTRTGWRECKGQEMHHWAIPQNDWGKIAPGWLKNQPWNLMPMPNGEFHDALHGWGEMDFGERLWYGTPDSLKAGAFSLGGREANLLFNNDSSISASSQGGSSLEPIPPSF